MKIVFKFEDDRRLGDGLYYQKEKDSKVIGYCDSNWPGVLMIVKALQEMFSS